MSPALVLNFEDQYLMDETIDGMDIIVLGDMLKLGRRNRHRGMWCSCIDTQL